MATHSRAWDDASPEVSEVVKYGPMGIRNFKEDFEERAGVDHLISSSTAVGATQDGVHDKLTMKATPDPELLADHGGGSMTLYTADENAGVELGATELFVLNEDGDSIQITNNGYLNNLYKSFLSAQSDDDKIIFVGKSSKSKALSISGYSAIADKEITFTDFLTESDLGSATIPETGLYLINVWIKSKYAPTFYTEYGVYNNTYHPYRIYQHGFRFDIQDWYSAQDNSLPSGVISGSICRNDLTTVLSKKNITYGNLYGATKGYYNRYFPWEEMSYQMAYPYYTVLAKCPSLMSPCFTWSGQLTAGDVIRFMFEFDFYENRHGHVLYLDAGRIEQDHYITIYKVG